MSSVCEENRAEFISQSYDRATVQSFALGPGSAASAASKGKITHQQTGRSSDSPNRDLCINTSIKISCLEFGIVPLVCMNADLSWADAKVLFQGGVSVPSPLLLPQAVG